MVRKAFSSFVMFRVLFVISGTAWPETIEVLIKRIDDGVKSSRDRDYEEAG